MKKPSYDYKQISQQQICRTEETGTIYLKSWQKQTDVCINLIGKCKYIDKYRLMQCNIVHKLLLTNPNKKVEIKDY